MFQQPHRAAGAAPPPFAADGPPATIRLHPVGRAGALAFALFLALSVLYFAYRIPLWNPEAPVMASLLLAAELFGTLTLLLHLYSTWTLAEGEAPSPPPGYEADIFITTWNESVEILRYTLLAAKRVRHARAVWLLDDGCRPEMAALAEELGVRYVAREDRSHAKAGNLNNALGISDAPFVAIFDCDHAPSPDFLERTLGYFIDPKVGFVQTPQDFYNIDSFQHRGAADAVEAWHEQTLFYRVIQPGKFHRDATFFCGSCAVIRRAALESIGGIATGTITEDMHTSLKLHNQGWSAVYHCEALAFGLSPADLEQYTTQRLRWGRGAMQVWLKEGIVFRGRLTLAQRLAYFTSAVTYFEGWQKGIVYLLPMAVLVTGQMPIIWTGSAFIAIFLAWLAFGMLANELFSRGYAKTLWMEEYNFLRFYTFIKATLALVIPIKWRFAVTPKGASQGTRDTLRLWPQFAIAYGALASVLVGCWLFETRHHLPMDAFLFNLLWVSLNALIALRALAFARRRLRQRRAEHRFPIPLVTRIDGRPSLLVAGDVSSNGMRVTVKQPVDTGSPLTGRLFLPDGPIAYAARVVEQRPSTNGRDTIIALRFDWPEPAAADRLNQCLYGNTLQWDVNDLSEARRFALLKRFLPGSVSTPGPWRLARLTAIDRTGSVTCLVRAEADTFRILGYQPVPDTQGLTLRWADSGEATNGLRLIGHRPYAIGGGQVHVAILAAEAIARPIVFHREPGWMQPAAGVAA